MRKLTTESHVGKERKNFGRVPDMEGGLGVS